jgi:hypothetical protein
MENVWLLLSFRFIGSFGMGEFPVFLSSHRADVANRFVWPFPTSVVSYSHTCT